MPSRLPVVGADTGVWGTVLNDWLTKTTAGIKNVQVYGATGDGATDDTAAFGSARDAGGAGATIYVPPATYVLTNLSLSVTGQTWIIDPAAKLLTKASTGSTPMIRVAAAGVTITGGGVLDGNGTNQTPGASQDIIKVNADKFTASGVIFQNGLQSGINFGETGSFNQTVVTGCRFSTIGYSPLLSYPIAVATDGVQIVGNTFDQYSATPWNATNAPNGMQFYNHPPTTTLSNVLIADNYIRCQPYLNTEYANQNSAIVMANVTGFTITGNTIPSTSFGFSIVACSNGTISGNCITGYSGYGIECPSSTTVTGNMINSTDPRAASGTHCGAAILVSTGTISYLDIIGNTITHVASDVASSVQVSPANPGDITRLTVSNNHCQHLGGGTCFLFNKAVSFLTVQGNVIDGNGQSMTCCWIVSDIAASPVTQFAVSVTDNIFANYGSGVGIQWGQTGTMANPALDYAIFANNIFRSGTTGIGALNSPVAGSHVNIAAGSNIGP